MRFSYPFDYLFLQTVFFSDHSQRLYCISFDINPFEISLENTKNGCNRLSIAFTNLTLDFSGFVSIGNYMLLSVIWI